MTLADEVYKEVIKRIPTAIRKFGADALGNQITKVTRNTSETSAKKLAAEVIKNLGIKLNEATFDELSLKLSEAEVDKILGKLLRIVDNIQSPEQLLVAEKYYDLAVRKIGATMHELSFVKSLYFISTEIDMMLKLARQKFSPMDEGQIYSTGGGCGQSYRKFTPKVDKTSISQESSIMKGLVDEGDVVPFKRRDWEALPQEVRQLSAEWYWAHSVEDGPEMESIAAQLSTKGFLIDYDYDGENIELTHKKSNRRFLLPLQDADNFTGWAQGTEPGYDDLNEDLRKWFKEKWVRFGPDGKIRGACARGSSKEGKPKCLPQKKAHALGKKGRKYAASKKRREDPNPERRGKAKNVATKKQTKEGVAEASGDTMKIDELKCWPGYTRVKGVKAGAPGSCKKKIKEVAADYNETERRKHIDPRDLVEGMFEDNYNNNNAGIKAALAAGIKLIPVQFNKDINGNWIYIHDNSGRYTVVVDVDGVSVPFYVSTGLGGKASVAVDKWYPFFGIGPGDGWINKGTEETINDYYGSRKLRHIAQTLNNTLKTPKRAKNVTGWPGNRGDESYFISVVNRDLDPTTNDDHSEKFRNNMLNVLSRLGEPNKYVEKHRPTKSNQPPKGIVFDKNNPEHVAAMDATTASERELNKTRTTNENKHRKCPSCGGELVSEEMLNEKKDACYYKVKSRYKVWPSAYASGALVKCRKKGAKNWGKSTTKENKGLLMPGTYEQEYNMFKKKGPERITAMTNEATDDPNFDAMFQSITEQEMMQEKWSEKYKRSINCNNPKGFSQRAHCQGRKKKAKK